jgi:hypothetical protein
MMHSDLDILQLQVDALFTHGPDGRIHLINEPDGGQAPRLFLGRTRLGNVWRLRHDLPDGLARDLERLLQAEPVVDDLRLPPAGLPAMRDLLASHGPADDLESGPAYVFPDQLPEPVDLALVDRTSLQLIEPFVDGESDRSDEELAARWPTVVRLEDGAPVALCFSARLTSRAAEAGVETLPASRGRGHAVAVVAGWATLIRRSGRVPLYSTSWENRGSQGVARRLGLRLYATDHSIS